MNNGSKTRKKLNEHRVTNDCDKEGESVKTTVFVSDNYIHDLGEVDESRQCEDLERERSGTLDDDDDEHVLHMSGDVKRSMKVAGGNGNDHGCDVSRNLEGKRATGSAVTEAMVSEQRETGDFV